MSETNGSACGGCGAGGTPVEILMQEHRVIETVLGATERMVESGAPDPEFLVKAVDFFRNFADGCHHAKEEDALFPVLEKAGVPREGGPIGCMLGEHDHGRRLIRAIAENLEGAARNDEAARDLVITAAREYCALLREHIHKEDNVLFAMASRVLGATEQAALLKEFAAAEAEHPDRHAQYLAIAVELADWKFASPLPRA